MKFGQYELLERIAMGGMAEVYKGRVVGAEGFEKLVAIKRILPDLAEDERFVKMLLTEARIHSALSHRNIVQIHDLGVSDEGEYCIVLEYVEGYDLRIIQEQLTGQGEIIPEALSLHIAAEVAQGLHFAHELRGGDGQPLGLVHRDVSPSNVLISLAGEVKLSDFGLAKRRHDRSVVGSLKGNLAYMSPEQARQASLDRRTDVFSLGAVLFEMLTGRRLRAITDEVAGWSQVASGAVPSARSVRPDLPESFERLLGRALAADPAQRFPDAASFGVALRELLAQMNAPVGASDLQVLLSALSPPKRPRSVVERSKVIRLGPEAQALREVISAPATPPPVVVAPKTPSPPIITKTPPAAARTPPLPVALRPQRTAVRFDGGAASPSPGLEDSDVTPPPAAPLPPVGARRNGPAGPTPFAQPEGPTPRGPLPLTRPRPAAGGAAPRAASLAAVHPAAAAPRPTRPTPPTAAQPIRPWGGAAPAAAVQGWNAPAPQLAHASGNNGWGGSAALAVAPVPTPRPRHETARVQVRPTGMWRPVAVVVSALVLAAAAAVHVAVIPLEVLFTWTRPAALYVTSEPEGASVKVDGVALTDPAPARISVQRDRLDHVIEVTHAGYRPARQTVRYDKSVALSFVIRLEPDPAATPARAGAPAPSAPQGGRKQ